MTFSDLLINSLSDRHWALDLRDGDLPFFHPDEQAFDQRLLDGVLLGLHGKRLKKDGPEYQRVAVDDELGVGLRLK